VLELFISWVSSGFSNDLPPKADLIVPFFKSVSYPLGVFGFIVLTYLVIVGAATPSTSPTGLDGLAIMPVVMVGSALGVFAYVTGSSVYSSYLLFRTSRVPASCSIFCAAMAGRGLAFLWFNTTRRRCSWATSARSRSAARWARSPSSPGRRSSSASWAASSSSRRCR
jgi:phospho-N-acetylmuramoyl-pentapeptide-transferase